jgi:hypothetical protein
MKRAGRRAAPGDRCADPRLCASIEPEGALEAEPPVFVPAYAQANGMDAVVQPLHAGDATGVTAQRFSAFSSARLAFQNANAVADTIIRKIRVGMEQR